MRSTEKHSVWRSCSSTIMVTVWRSSTMVWGSWMCCCTYTSWCSPKRSGLGSACICYCGTRRRRGLKEVISTAMRLKPIPNNHGMELV